MTQNPLATIFEGAAGFGSDPTAPPGGRPPYGPAPSGALPPAYMGQPGAPQEAAPSIPGWVWLAGAALLGGGLLYLNSRSKEEDAAADDDDGRAFSSNSGSVKFMEPYSKNGSDEDVHMCLASARRYKAVAARKRLGSRRSAVACGAERGTRRPT